MITPPNLVANGNINPSRFIKLDATINHGALQGTANAICLGVSQDGPKDPPGTGGSTLAAAAGDQFSHFTVGQICRVQSGAAVAAGDELESDANGKAITALTTAATVRRISGIALEAAGGADEFIEVLLMCYAKTMPA